LATLNPAREYFNPKVIHKLLTGCEKRERSRKGTVSLNKMRSLFVKAWCGNTGPVLVGAVLKLKTEKVIGICFLRAHLYWALRG
jgi:hypothetical protein